MHILIVEDETKLAAFIKKGIEQECGYIVDAAHDGEAGLLHTSTYEYDLIILDLMLPGKDGLEVLREIRARAFRSPVLLLTAKDSIESKVQGLENGADDYLTKPFDLRELVARSRAVEADQRRAFGGPDRRRPYARPCDKNRKAWGAGLKADGARIRPSRIYDAEEESRAVAGANPRLRLVGRLRRLIQHS
jgi:DNA-binding response OmpR family regulator